MNPTIYVTMKKVLQQTFFIIDANTSLAYYFNSIIDEAYQLFT